MAEEPVCGACGAGFAPAARFCHRCGAKRPESCAACAAELPPAARFCAMCGAACAAAAPEGTPETLTLAGDAERRQMTVLFADLVGSTPLSEALDPEALRDFLAAYRSLCAEAVERLGGTVTKLIGDGLDAHFGYPVDYEDSAQRAVRAGLEIAAAVPGLAARFPDLPAPPAARIGINTGLVVVGDVGAGALREKQGVIGETPNVAARLQTLALPGEVVIGQPTFRLVSREFRFRPLGPQALKGLTQPMECYAVVEVVREPEAAPARAPEGLIGRDGELAILRQNWRRAASGEGQTVLLAGEAGIGKSRLVGALVDELRGSEDFASLRLYGTSIQAATAFRPFIREIVRRAGFAEGEGDAARLDKLEALCDGLGLDRDVFMPPLASTLSVELGGRYAKSADPSAVKHRFQAACAALIDAATGERTLLLLVEDLHWADPSTLEFLGQWISETARRRCLMILTFRPSFENRWRDEGNLSTLVLNRLSRAESRELALRTAGKPLPEEVAATILQRTDGVPLFIEELTKMVLESGLLAEAPGEFRLSGPLPPLAIPDSLQNSLMARLDKLATVKEVAQIAAAIGRRFRRSLLAAVTGADAAELDAALEKLHDAELLLRFGFPPEVDYEFRHALVQDAAYSSMLKSSRQRVHMRIAEVMAQNPRLRELEPEIIARHYLAGGAPVKAAPFAFAAGQRALDASAHQEAVRHFADALEHLDDMAAGPARDRLELDIRTAYGVPLQTLRGYAHSSVRKNYERVEALARGLGATAELMPLYYGMSRYHMLGANYAEAEVGGEKLLAAAAAAGDPIFLAAGRRILASILFYTGRIPEAREHLLAVLSSGLVEADYSTARQVDVVDFRVAANAYMAWVEALQGRPNAARDYAGRSIEVAEGLSHRFSQAFATCFACWTHEFVGDRERARALAASGLAMSREHGFQFWIGWTEIILAATGGERPARLTPAGYARKGLTDWEEVGSRLGLSYLLALTIELLAEDGDRAAAIALLDQAEGFLAESGERFWAPEITRLKGVLRRRSEPAAAEALFRRALAEADALGARLLGLRAVLSLAEIPGRAEEAKRMAKERLLGFAADEAAAELRDARALLARKDGISA